MCCDLSLKQEFLRDTRRACETLPLVVMHTGDISLVRRIHTGRWGVAVWAAHRPVPAPVPVTGTERVASRYRGSGVPVVTARLVAAALMWHRHSISSRTRAQSSHPAEQHCERQTAQSTASTLPPTRTVPHPTPPLKAATSETSGVPRAPQAACTCTVLRARHNKFQTPTAPPSLLPLAAALERPRAASTCCVHVLRPVAEFARETCHHGMWHD